MVRGYSRRGLVKVWMVRCIHVERIAITPGIWRVCYWVPERCGSLWKIMVARLSVYWRVKALRISLSLELGIHTIGRKVSSYIEWRWIAFYAGCVRRLQWDLSVFPSLAPSIGTFSNYSFPSCGSPFRDPFETNGPSTHPSTGRGTYP